MELLDKHVVKKNARLSSKVTTIRSNIHRRRQKSTAKSSNGPTKTPPQKSPSKPVFENPPKPHDLNFGLFSDQQLCALVQGVGLDTNTLTRAELVRTCETYRDLSECSIRVWYSWWSIYTYFKSWLVVVPNSKEWNCFGFQVEKPQSPAVHQSKSWIFMVSCLNLHSSRIQNNQLQRWWVFQVIQWCYPGLQIVRNQPFHNNFLVSPDFLFHIRCKLKSGKAWSTIRTLWSHNLKHWRMCGKSGLDSWLQLQWSHWRFRSSNAVWCWCAAWDFRGRGTWSTTSFFISKHSSGYFKGCVSIHINCLTWNLQHLLS